MATGCPGLLLCVALSTLLKFASDCIAAGCFLWSPLMIMVMGMVRCDCCSSGDRQRVVSRHTAVPTLEQVCSRGLSSTQQPSRSPTMSNGCKLCTCCAQYSADTGPYSDQATRPRGISPTQFPMHLVPHTMTTSHPQTPRPITHVCLQGCRGLNTGNRQSFGRKQHLV